MQMDLSIFHLICEYNNERSWYGLASMQDDFMSIILKQNIHCKNCVGINSNYLSL